MKENSEHEINSETCKTEELLSAHMDTGSNQPIQNGSAKRIPWGALTFGLVALGLIIVGYYGLQNRAKSSVVETREAIELAILAQTAASGQMTSEAGKATAEVEAITATKAKEEQILTGTAERNAQIATGTAEREAQIATGTVGAELTAAHATFDYHMRETELVVTYEAAQTQAAIAVAETQAESARQTQESVDSTRAAIAALTQTAEAEATQFAWAQTATQMAKYQVGDIIKFGRYEQDNNKNNGAEEIEWRILAQEGNTALLVSVMGLDAKPYHQPGGNITWEDCTLRAWLNSEFYNAAFSDSERARIELTHVVNEDNPYRATKGGNDTEDDVFLLSIAEAERYFRDDEDRKLKPTKYVKANGAYTNSDNGNGWWWLRSPGNIQEIAAYVYSDGVVRNTGLGVRYSASSVRPALRIYLGK